MTVAVDAVIYARIFDATMSIINVENAHGSTKLLAATTLRNVLGTKQLSEILSDREAIAHQMQVRDARKNRAVCCANICTKMHSQQESDHDQYYTTD